jgi:apolipoprotein N-acyltransferase
MMHIESRSPAGASTCAGFGFLPRLGAILSGALLTACFPPLARGDMAWIALVPFLLALRRADRRTAIRLGFLCGAVYWLITVSWLLNLPEPFLLKALGWLLLGLYCAIYFIPVAVVGAWMMRTADAGRPLVNLLWIPGFAAAWAGFEYFRSTWFTGFAWNALGISQFGNLVLIQHARWGGVYAVSALLAALNMAVALTVLDYVRRRGRPGLRPHLELIAGVLLLGAAYISGFRALRAGAPAGHPVQIAQIQTGIPQTQKWDADTVEMIYERLESLTRNALITPDLDLVVWPETALPDEIMESPRSFQLVHELAAGGVPLLVGTMDIQRGEGGIYRYFNSSYLFDAAGVPVQAYDKRHLVLFGEYVPLHDVFPFVNTLAPIPASFSSGTTSTVFALPDKPVTFSVLICFEDTVAGLARESVRNGARLIINQTNDAWFDPRPKGGSPGRPSAASRQHMAHGVFRAVENRVPVIRVANTGVTCTIDPFGRVYNVLEDRGHTRFPGFQITQVEVPPPGSPSTFYTRHGDRFAHACAAAGLLLLVAAWRARPEL